MHAVPLTPLGSAAEILLATDHDPYVRGSLREVAVRGWMGDGASAWMSRDVGEQHPSLAALGPPPAVGGLLHELLPHLTTRQPVTLPRGSAAHLPAWVGLDGTDWDFRWTDRAPAPQPGENAVGQVGDATEVAALLTASSPRASTLPGDPAVRRWFGVRDGDGRLVACAADASIATGVGYLSSVAVAPGQRGQGLGSAVTAALTRRLLAEGCDLVTLALYADNTAARALYDRLGFRDEHRFTSGPLLVRGQW